MEVLRDVSDLTWNRFLDPNPESSIFQSPLLRSVYRKTTGYRPFVFAVESGDEIEALVSGAIVSSSPGMLARLSSRVVIVGGPIGNQDLFPAVLNAVDELARNSAVFSQIRNLKAPEDRSTFESVGYEWEDHLNFVVDFDQPPEILWRGMSKARRKAIERADDLGLRMVELGPQDLGPCYQLLRATYSRAKVPLADRSLFSNAFELLSDPGHLWALGASSSDSLCAVRLILRWKRTLFDWYAGSSELGRSMHADEWLVWQILQKGIECECASFDFGGAGAPGQEYGPGEFKRRFGGRKIEPGRFVKTYHPWTRRVGTSIYQLWRLLS